MTAFGDRIAPKLAKKLFAKLGGTATLESVSGNVIATGIRITPPRERRVFMPDTKIEEVVGETMVAAQDAALIAVSFPEPRKGDLLTIRGQQKRLVEGTGAIPSGDQVAEYRLRWRG